MLGSTPAAFMRLRRPLAIVVAAAAASGVPGFGATINVNSDSTLASALASVNPGDVVVLADGVYSGFTVTRSGASGSPIVIRAANLLGATISSGVVHLQACADVTLSGLNLTTPGAARTIDGESFRVAVWFEASQRCRLTQSRLQLSGQASGTEWVMLSGASNENRIDHNEFGANAVRGHYVWARGNRTGIAVPSDRTDWASGNGPYNSDMARHTRIDHNYFHDQSTGLGAAIVFGGIGLAGDYQATYSLAEYNLLVNCDGDAELFEVKSSNNTIRHNTIRTSVGTISLRAGNQGAITGNLMLQGGKAGSGGIKLYEKDHVITGNYVENAADYSLVVGAGDSYTSPSFGHAQVVNATITGNSFVSMNTRGVIIGHGGDGTVAPDGGAFSDNALRGDASPLLNLRRPGTMTLANNTTSGAVPAMPAAPLTTAQVGPFAALPQASRLLNLSTRGLVQSGDQVLIAGFVIDGVDPKRLLLRAVGPKLAELGVSNPLSNPRLSLKRLVAGAFVDHAANDDWGAAANAGEIASAAGLVGAFALDAGSPDAALLLDLPPGVYTAIVEGIGGATGNGLVELYDASADGVGERLVNISTRGFVSVGDGIMIPGFVVSSEGPRTLLVRAAGPALGESPFNLAGVLADPQLTIFRREPDGSHTVVAVNDDWSAVADPAVTASVAERVGAFSLASGSKDAAIVVTLEPGVYTMHASGVGGATGIALVEVYEVR